MKNGYVYHTKYDTERAIPQGSIQRAGDNVLAMVRHLLNADILSHTATAKDGSVVFFDLLGLCLIYYPAWLGNIINIGVVAVSFYLTYSKIKNAYRYGVTSNVYVGQLFHSFLAQISGCFASFVTVTIIASICDGMGTSYVLLQASGHTHIIFHFQAVQCPGTRSRT